MEKEKTIVIKQASHTCPVCGGELTITEEALDGYGCGHFPWKCEACGSSGQEHFEMKRVFLGHEEVRDVEGASISIVEPEEDEDLTAEAKIEDLSALLVGGYYHSLERGYLTLTQAHELAVQLVNHGVTIVSG